MNPAPEPLPNDVAVLRAMLAEAWAERDAERAEKAQLAAQNDRLRHLIRQLQRLQFGRRSEKLDPDQLNLGLEDVEQAIAETEAKQKKGRSGIQARSRRDAPGRPRLAPRAPAAGRGCDRAREYRPRMLRWPNAGHWRRSLATARRYPGAVSGSGHPPAKI